jgi:hypothetical protein
LDVNKENREKQLAEVLDKAKREDEKVKHATEQREAHRLSLSTRAHSLFESVSTESCSVDDPNELTVDQLLLNIQQLDEFSLAGGQYLTQLECDEEKKQWQKKVQQAKTRLDLMQTALDDRRQESGSADENGSDSEKEDDEAAKQQPAAKGKCVVC